MTIALRRSRRGLPAIVDHVQHDSTAQTGAPVHVDPTNVSRDLTQDQAERLGVASSSPDEGVAGLKLETRFYAGFVRGDNEKGRKVYGKKQKGVTRRKVEAEDGEFSVGDTVLVEAVNSVNAAVGVIIGIWKVFKNDGADNEDEGEDEEQGELVWKERYTNVLIHWFSRPSNLAANRPPRAELYVRSRAYLPPSILGS
jgi:origin recognition complex subunit 1